MQRVLDAFNEVLQACTVKHGKLVALTAAGWVEGFPSEESWHFTHPEYPGFIVDWHPGGEPKAR